MHLLLVEVVVRHAVRHREDEIAGAARDERAPLQAGDVRHGLARQKIRLAREVAAVGLAEELDCLAVRRMRVDGTGYAVADLA